MDKARDILEKNVEWIALGLAGLFLAFVAWTYWVKDPVYKEIGGEKFTASRIDEKVHADAAEKLRAKLGQGADVEMPKVAINIDLRTPPPPPLPGLALKSPPPKTRPGGIDVPPPNLEQVAKLPAVPVVTDLDFTSGRSFVAIPLKHPREQRLAAEEAARAAVAPDADDRTPAGFIRQAPTTPGGVAGTTAAGQPTVDAAGNPIFNPAANIPADYRGSDVMWRTVEGKFDHGALLKAFEDAKIPPELNQIVYLAVELERIECDAQGNPVQGAKPVRVPPLPINDAPFDRFKDIEVPDYIYWAAQPSGQLAILKPLFYTVHAGDPWRAPSDPEPVNLNDPAVAVNPGAVQNFFQNGVFQADQAYQHYKMLPTPKEKTAFVKNFEPKEKAQLMKLKAEDEARERQMRAQQNQANRSSTRTPRTPRTPQPRDRGATGMQAEDPRAMREMLAQTQFDPRGRPIPAGPGGRSGMFDPAGGLGAGSGGGTVGPTGAWTRPMDPMTQAQNNALVLDNQGRFDVRAHDVSGTPGRTYKYRIRVIVQNPLYGTQGVAKDQAMAASPFLPSDPNEGWSAWSKPVTLPTDLDMMFASAGGAIAGSGKAPRVNVNIRRWQNGQANFTPQPVTVEPGDTIGTKAAGVDFSTGWTVVDIRQVGNDVKVRIMDKDGNIDVRSVRADENHPMAKEIEAARRGPVDPNATPGAGPATGLPYDSRGGRVGPRGEPLGRSPR